MNSEPSRERLSSVTPSDSSHYASASSGSGDELSEAFKNHLNLQSTSFSLNSITPLNPLIPSSPTPTNTIKVIPTYASQLINAQSNLPSSDSKTFPNNLQQQPISIALLNPLEESIGLRTAVIFQDACVNHCYKRTTDSASLLSIVERPERIRAIKTGVATAWSRLEGKRVAKGGISWKRDSDSPSPNGLDSRGVDAKDLDKLMSGLGLKDSKGKGKEVVGGPFDILFSDAILPVNNTSLLYIHPSPNLPPPVDISSFQASPPSSPTTSTSKLPTTPKEKQAHLLETNLSSSAPPKLSRPIVSQSLMTPPAWPYQLQKLCRNSTKAITTPPFFSEIPKHLPQGDLYLSEGSESAIFGALGAVCEGVDKIVEGARNGVTGYDRAFVAIRPPGHHCCEENPMGFCFVNNVAVAAAHAYHKHGIDRVIILDIDLHHGNGTQDIAWRINAEANSASLLPTGSPRKGSPKKVKRRELQVMYGSLHDVFSYPCEDGDAGMIQAASLNLSGGHSQYISNVHLESWTDEKDFYERLYPRYMNGLLGAASEFCKKTTIGNEDASDKTIVIISAGFDASEHESAGMSRHRRNVPTSFYHKFSLDAAQFANKYAQGKLLSVLEGGYSDRALSSGTLAMMIGLTEAARLGQLTVKSEVNVEAGVVEEKVMNWWEEKHLIQIEKACKSKKGGKLTGTPTTASYSSILSGSSTSSLSIGSALEQQLLKRSESWLAKTVEIFSIIEGSEISLDLSKEKKDKESLILSGKPMTLRERRPRGGDDITPVPSPLKSTNTKGIRATSKIIIPELLIPSEGIKVVESKLEVLVKEERTQESINIATGIVEEVFIVKPKIKFTFKEAGI